MDFLIDRLFTSDLQRKMSRGIKNDTDSKKEDVENGEENEYKYTRSWQKFTMEITTRNVIRTPTGAITKQTDENAVDTNCEISRGKRTFETQTTQAKVINQRQNVMRKKHFGRVVLPASSNVLDISQVFPSSYEGSGEYVDPNDPYVNTNDPKSGPNDTDTKPKYLEVLAESYNASTEVNGFNCRHLRVPICKCSASGYYNVQCKTCQRKGKSKPKYDDTNY
uniref:Uncharacterized protein n=1 Tax=Magallana gigas TaxID=29159 RepID=A0A8W8LFH8_MAGGI